MSDESGDRGRPTPAHLRQGRLKLALRENLKRRKLQARERSRMTDAADGDEAPPREEPGKGGGEA